MERRLGSGDVEEIARLSESFGSNVQCSPLFEGLTIGHSTSPNGVCGRSSRNTPSMRSSDLQRQNEPYLR